MLDISLNRIIWGFFFKVSLFSEERSVISGTQCPTGRSMMYFFHHFVLVLLKYVELKRDLCNFLQILKKEYLMMDCFDNNNNSGDHHDKDSYLTSVYLLAGPSK